VDDPVVRVHDVRPFAGDDRGKRPHDAGVGERLRRTSLEAEECIDPLHQPCHAVHRDPVLNLRSGGLARLDERRDGNLVASLRQPNGEVANVPFFAPDDRWIPLGEQQDPHRAVAFMR
jgi:hypothetical protein